MGLGGMACATLELALQLRTLRACRAPPRMPSPCKRSCQGPPWGRFAASLGRKAVEGIEGMGCKQEETLPGNRKGLTGGIWKFLWALKRRLKTWAGGREAFAPRFASDLKPGRGQLRAFRHRRQKCALYSHRHRHTNTDTACGWAESEALGVPVP